jgi:hypothetical protein
MSGPKFLSRVEKTFAIPGCGVRVKPGIPCDGNKHFVFIGDPIEIRKPDGQRLLTSISGIEMANTPPEAGIALLLPEDMQAKDVPVGSELWHEELPR